VFRYLFLAVALTLAGATTASASWITRDVNVRSGPGTGHHVRHVARACTPVDVHGHRGGWVRVGTRHGDGWVSARYVSHSRPHHCQARRQVQHDRGPQVHVYIAPPHPRVWHHQPRHPELRRRHRPTYETFGNWQHW
jgi:uncharacterized protein YraI